MSAASLATRGSSVVARRDVRMAIEWCGIIAFIQATSPTKTWLRNRNSAAAKTTTLPAKMAMLTTRLAYMLSMNASMITAMAAPIQNAM